MDMDEEDDDEDDDDEDDDDEDDDDDEEEEESSKPGEKRKAKGKDAVVPAKKAKLDGNSDKGNLSLKLLSFCHVIISIFTFKCYIVELVCSV